MRKFIIIAIIVSTIISIAWICVGELQHGLLGIAFSLLLYACLKKDELIEEQHVLIEKMKGTIEDQTTLIGNQDKMLKLNQKMLDNFRGQLSIYNELLKRELEKNEEKKYL